MSTRREQIDLLFAAALDRPEAERERFLVEAAEGDAVLVAEVRAMLGAHARMDGVLDSNLFAASWLMDEPRLPARLGPWRVGTELGRGGMGVVYLADRADGQFERRVAIKLLGGHPSPELTLRLEVERRILAGLDHPNIARLFDAGVTEEGRPYLVMEYVDGLPVDRYCDGRRATVVDRLRLFRDVAHAVHHAHRNLVVHRDLKPSNILVTPDGQVKLLDFGIAKLLDQPSGDGASPTTRTGLRLMTPEYASPEQVRGETVTTASDVYALGVVLYELLTGRRPFRLEGRTLGDWERALFDEEPPRPSVAVLTPPEPVGRDGHRPETPENISRSRNTTPERLARALRGDLDRIALMALRKEPDRRYASAEQMAEDIERYLDGQPVRAHTDSRWYVVRKFVRRHRIQATAAVVVALSLLGGLGAALWQAGVAGRARDRAEAAQGEAEQVSSFLIGLFEGGDPAAAGSNALAARDLLRRGVAQAEALQDQPGAQARMFDAIGRVYDNLGAFDEARAAFERAMMIARQAYGADHLRVAEAMTHLANHLRRQAQYRAADSLYRAALDLQHRLAGEFSAEAGQTLTEMGRLAADQGQDRESEAVLRRALAVRQAALGPDHPDVATSLRNVGAILRRMGRLDEAEPYYRGALDLLLRVNGPEHTSTAGAMAQLAILLSDRPEGYAEAERLHRQALALFRRVHGEPHPAVSGALGQVAGVVADQGRLAEAEPLIREALTMRERIYGREHPAVAESLGHLARLLVRMGRYQEADSLYRESIGILGRVFAPDHPGLAGPSLAHGDLLLQRGDRAGAEAQFRTSLAIREKHSAPGSHFIAVPAARLGEFLIDQGRFDEAEPLLLKAWTIRMASLSPTDSLTREAAGHLVRLYRRWGKPVEAEKYVEQAESSRGS